MPDLSCADRNPAGTGPDGAGGRHCDPQPQPFAAAVGQLPEIMAVKCFLLRIPIKFPSVICTKFPIDFALNKR